MNRQGKTHEGIEERMQIRKQGLVERCEIYKSKDVRCRVKCKRMVEHVYSVFFFFFGSENWSWTKKTFNRIKGWETKAMKSSISLSKRKG